MIHQVVKIVEVMPYKVTLEFNSGEVKVFDFEIFFRKHEKNKEAVVHKLKDKSLFMQVKLSREFGTIYWEDLSTMIDLDGSSKPSVYDPAPEVLYEMSVPVSSSKISN